MSKSHPAILNFKSKDIFLTDGFLNEKYDYINAINTNKETSFTIKKQNIPCTIISFIINYKNANIIYTAIRRIILDDLVTKHLKITKYDSSDEKIIEEFLKLNIINIPLLDSIETGATFKCSVVNNTDKIMVISTKDLYTQSQKQLNDYSNFYPELMKLSPSKYLNFSALVEEDTAINDKLFSLTQCVATIPIINGKKVLNPKDFNLIPGQIFEQCKMKIKYNKIVPPKELLKRVFATILYKLDQVKEAQIFNNEGKIKIHLKNDQYTIGNIIIYKLLKKNITANISPIYGTNESYINIVLIDDIDEIAIKKIYIDAVNKSIKLIKKFQL